MKKLILLSIIFAAALTSACNRNTEVEVPYKYEVAARRFVDNFNAQQFDSIYTMYADTIRRILTPEASAATLHTPSTSRPAR